jgi:hypothetical protein
MKDSALEFPSDVAAIAAAIGPFAIAPDWLKYPEDMAARSIPSKILPHRLMWQAISKVHDSLAFNPKMAENIMMCVARDHSTDWNRELSAEELKDFRQRMGKRLRKMARDIRQAQVKKTGWGLKLMNTGGLDDGTVADDGTAADDEGELLQHGEDGDEDFDEEKEHTVPTVVTRPTLKRPAAAEPLASTTKTEYFYGFDWELSSAWREPAEGGRRCYAAARISDDGLPDGHPVALFDYDEGDVSINALTNAELKDKLSTALYRKGNLWDCDLPSGGRLRVARHSASSLLQPLFRLMQHFKSRPYAKQRHPEQQG